MSFGQGHENKPFYSIQRSAVSIQHKVAENKEGNHFRHPNFLRIKSTMLAEIVTASISAAGALLVAVAGYYFTKKREREADWRKEKLGYYKAFVSSLSKALGAEPSAEGKMQFVTASNDLLLFAPQPVIVALRALLEEIRPSNITKSAEKHDELLSKLFYEMRADLGVKPEDDPATFRVMLWSPGEKSRATHG